MSGTTKPTIWHHIPKDLYLETTCGTGLQNTHSLENCPVLHLANSDNSLLTFQDKRSPNVGKELTLLTS